MKIPLYGRKGIVAWARVSRRDFDWLNENHWNLMANGYAYRRGRNDEGRAESRRIRECIFMHREILGLVKGDGLQVDHVNRDRLDNRRCNLRVVMPRHQGHNIMRHGNFTSQFRGVAWDQKSGRWESYVHVRGRKFSAGRFDSEREAARAAQALRFELLSHAVD
jgi:hypothetical protein